MSDTQQQPTHLAGDILRIISSGREADGLTAHCTVRADTGDPGEVVSSLCVDWKDGSPVDVYNVESPAPFVEHTFHHEFPDTTPRRVSAWPLVSSYREDGQYRPCSAELAERLAQMPPDDELFPSL